MTVLNITQHPASPEQVEAGVIDPHGSLKTDIVGLLTFNDIPKNKDIRSRAVALADIAHKWAKETKATCAMIGGAPFLMAPLTQSLCDKGICPVFAFSKRESKEETLSDGSVVKTSVFKHAAFIKALAPEDLV